MALATVGVQDHPTPDHLIENEDLGSDVVRQRVAATGLDGKPVETDTVKGAATAPDVQTLTAGAQEVLAANPDRKSFMLQNVGVLPIPVVLSADTPTATSYHFVLAAGQALHDGKGGFFTDSQYQGEINVFGVVGALLAVTEF